MLPKYWQTFPVTGELVLVSRPSNKAPNINDHPDLFTTDQLLLRSTMNKYGLTLQETASILSISTSTMTNYLTLPTNPHFQTIPSTYPALLDAYCRTHRA